MLKFVILLLIVLVRDKAFSKEIFCDKVGPYDYNRLGIGSPKSCYMRNNSTIDSNGFEIASLRDESVEGLTLSHNKMIRFLPEKIFEKFPNLLIYIANNCSLSRILKNNFKGLEKLKILSLSSNQIEIINSDTFEDLSSLEVLGLRKEKLILFQLFVK